MKGSSEGLAPGTLDPYNLPVPLPLKENPEVPGSTLDIRTCKLDLLQNRGCKLVCPGCDLPICLVFLRSVFMKRCVESALFLSEVFSDAQCFHFTRKSRFLALLAFLARKIRCYALYSIVFLILIFAWISIFFFLLMHNLQSRIMIISHVPGFFFLVWPGFLPAHRSVHPSIQGASMSSTSCTAFNTFHICTCV